MASSNPVQNHTTMAPKTVQLAGRQYKPLRQPVLTWVWNVSNTIAAFYLWLSVLPYRIAEALTPDPLNKYVVDVGTYVWVNYTEPLSNVIQSLAYQTFDFVDQQVDWLITKVTNVHSSNMRHFRVALEGYLRMFQEKASVVEQHGLRGVPAAMSMKTS